MTIKTNDETILIVSLNAGDDVPDGQLLKLTHEVQKQLRGQGLEVRKPEAKELPEGAKSGGAFDINLISTLIVPLFASGGLITTIIAILQQWVLRKEGRTVKFKAQKGDNSFEFEYNPTITTHDELATLAEKLAKLMDNPNDADNPPTVDND
jgi:hypothetical protein